MKIFRPLFTVLCAGWLAIGSAHAQTSAEEIERREAAARSVLAMSLTLAILRFECRHWLAGSGDEVDVVALQWWQRNRADIDAAVSIVGEAIQRNTTTLSKEADLVARRAILEAMSRGHIETMRGMFLRQQPTPASCRRVIQQYKGAELDIANLGSKPGYERFAEFSETLKRTRADKNYRQPEESTRTFEIQILNSSEPLVTLDAIDAAWERRDITAVVKGFASLVERGDPKAAQSLGLIYFDGQHLPVDLQRALTWFYTAWAMGDAEGINAIGVMARDGYGLPRNDQWAIAAFALARQLALANQPAAKKRADENYRSLRQKLSNATIIEAGCMDAATFADQLRTLASQWKDISLGFTPKLAPGPVYDFGAFDSTADSRAACEKK